MDLHFRDFRCDDRSGRNPVWPWASQKATAFWKSHSWTLYLLPLVGLLIVWLYRFAHEEKNRGTDMVLDSISSTEEVTPATAPLIFISTLLSHLATASVGREEQHCSLAEAWET